ncbi:hypothetical protein [Allobranchiibius sp. GilTou38]|uniref:hypothetical protein n=1 Tax=Allobranchiibius sp. GilTou38 TaxID=2815210 RepID=UPI001AA118E2|nr:hypothetical protein [Allobranchiibius sp. GilTou38]MBO1765600.1 hypothetical protein [Allobranchiibius sp. GilTou38]
MPRLPEVHVAFASSSLCEVCAELAFAADADALTERAVRGWAEEQSDGGADAVRLVMAWAGHPLPVDPTAEDKAPVLPLSAQDQQVWQRLEPLMVDGPARPVSVQGRIVREERGESPTYTDVVRDGSRTRLSGTRGDPWLVSDGVTTWERWDDTGMVASPYTGEQWYGDGSELACRRSHEDVELFDFGTPVGPIEQVQCLGRDVWSFRFASPPHKPYDMQVVVDAETGLVLDQRFGDFSVSRWTDFRVGEPVADELFVWDGPVVTRADPGVEGKAEHERLAAEGQRWFETNVTPALLEVRGKPVSVFLHGSADDGEFQASLSGGVDGLLARRPRSDEWWNLGWSQVTARWSDGTWDWALLVWDHLDDGRTSERVAAVGRWLGG